MVYTRDLKSLVCNGHAGSSPAPGTRVYSLIAQLVERRTVNPQVPGSSPGRGAKRCGNEVNIVSWRRTRNGPIMVLERIANPSIGESRFLSSSLSHSAILRK